MNSFIPFNYQKFMIEKIITTPRLGLFVPMGMGKSACTLSAINSLLNDYLEIKRVLIIGPLNVSKFTWEDEKNKWVEFQDLTISKAIGNEEKRIKAINSDSDICIINRENVDWLQNYYIENKIYPNFDMIVLDESSSFKNRASKRFKAIKNISLSARRILLLSGTPSPNGIEDLWSQMYLLDRGVRLGRTITEFRNRYMVKASNIFNIYKPRKGADLLVYEKIKDITVSLKNNELKLPMKIEKSIDITLPDKVKKEYNNLEKDYFLELEGKEITAMNAAVVMNKLIQVASGAIYTGNEREYISLHSEKIEALRKILENTGENVMVFYNYEHEKTRIFKALSDFNPRTLESEKDKRDWDEGNIRLLVVHPASAGHGLNLQTGGRIIVWFSLTWNLEYYEQANARLHRLGQDKTVFIYRLICKDTVDEEVEKRLKNKACSQEEMLDYIRAKINEITRS